MASMRTCLSIIAVLLQTQDAVAADPSKVLVGTWEGSMNGLPAVEVTLVIRGDKLAGQIVFPFHQRTPEGKWVVTRRDVTPILNPRLRAIPVLRGGPSQIAWQLGMGTQRAVPG